MRALGGHYVLSYHSQVLATPALVPALATVARRLAADTAVWVATVGDVADWWKKRAEVDASAFTTVDGLRVMLRNRGDHAVQGLVVRVPNADAKRVARADGRLLPSADRTIRLAVPPLPGHATRVLKIILAGPVDRRAARR